MGVTAPGPQVVVLVKLPLMPFVSIGVVVFAFAISYTAPMAIAALGVTLNVIEVGGEEVRTWYAWNAHPPFAVRLLSSVYPVALNEQVEPE